MKYQSIEEAYNKGFPRLVSIAKSNLRNPDHAIDCVHDVFVSLLKRKCVRISDYYLVRDVARKSQALNKKLLQEPLQELPYDVQDNGRGVRESDTEATFDSENTFE